MILFTPDEIIEMAEQCGIDPHDMCEDPRIAINNLERFAKLVDAKATAREREACHALRQTLLNPHTNCQVSSHAYDMALVAYGKAIRERGQQ